MFGALLAVVVAFQQRERALQVAGDLGHRQHARPVGGQQHRQRQPADGVHQRADCVALCDGVEVGPQGVRSGDEQLGGVVGCEALQRQQPLARKLQPRARRGADLERRCRLQQPLAQARQIAQMLAVVEHQQQRARLQGVADQAERIVGRARHQAQLGGQARHHLRQRGEIIERDPQRTIGEACRQRAQRLLGEAALAGAARAGDGERAALVACQQRGQILQLARAPDEAVARGRGRRGIAQQRAHAQRRLDAELLGQALGIGAVGLAQRVAVAARLLRRQQRDDRVFVERVARKQRAREQRRIARRRRQPRQVRARDALPAPRVFGAHAVEPFGPRGVVGVVEPVEQLAAPQRDGIGGAALVQCVLERDHIGVNLETHRAALRFERSRPWPRARGVQRLAHVGQRQCRWPLRPQQGRQLSARHPAAPQREHGQQLAPALGRQGHASAVVDDGGSPEEVQRERHAHRVGAPSVAQGRDARRPRPVCAYRSRPRKAPAESDLTRWAGQGGPRPARAQACWVNPACLGLRLGAKPFFASVSSAFS